MNEKPLPTHLRLSEEASKSGKKNTSGATVFVLRLHEPGSITHGMVMGTSLTREGIDWQIVRLRNTPEMRLFSSNLS